jgi:hypothetical protein
MPFVTTAIRFPPPASALLDPNPLTTIVIPIPSRHGHRRKQKGVFVAVGRGSPTDDEAGITDRSRDGEDLEAALGKIAKRVEIEHLSVRVKERMLGVVARRGGSDNHSGCVSATTPGDTVGLACASSECPQIGDGEGRLGVNLADDNTD